MERLDRYLEENWPTLVDECDSHNTQDIAIHIMQTLAAKLVVKDIETARLRRIEDAAWNWMNAPLSPGGPNVELDILIVTLRQNPRPKETDDA